MLLLQRSTMCPEYKSIPVFHCRCLSKRKVTSSKPFCSLPTAVQFNVCHTFGIAAPTASIAACGGLTMAANCLMPNMPRLLMVKVPPMNSSGWSLFSFAYSTNTAQHSTPWLGAAESNVRSPTQACCMRLSSIQSPILPLPTLKLPPTRPPQKPIVTGAL